jgi:hypothetical protein
MRPASGGRFVYPGGVSSVKRSLLCVVLATMMLLAGVSTAFAGIGYFTENKVKKAGNGGVIGTGASSNKVSDMKTVVDPTYKHQAWGFSTTCVQKASNLVPVEPYHIYVETKVAYVTWHVIVGDVEYAATAENHNAKPNTAWLVKAPANGYATAWNYGGIARYAYTRGIHQFRLTASSANYTWVSREQINN